MAAASRPSTPNTDYNHTPGPSTISAAAAQAAYYKAQQLIVEQQGSFRLQREKEEFELKKRRDEEIHKATLESLRNRQHAPAQSSSIGRGGDEDDDEGKLTPAAKQVLQLYTGTSRTYMVAIFLHTFKPEDLLKLVFSSYLADYDNAYNLEIVKGTLKQRKTVGKLKDFGKGPSSYSEGFLKYASIVQDFFGKEHPEFHQALLQFHKNVVGYNRIYKWQKSIPPMVIAFHKERYYKMDILESTAWELKDKWILMYCRAHA